MKYIKSILFGISALSFSDLVIFPKPIKYLNSNYSIVGFILIIICLLILNITQYKRFEHFIDSNKTSYLSWFLTLLMFIYSYILIDFFTFFQTSNYIVMFLLFSPLIYLIEEMFIRYWKWKKGVMTGLIIILVNFIYFKFIYQPFEVEYWDGNPIYFVYERIKKWGYYLGIIITFSSLLSSYLRRNKNNLKL